MTEELQGIQQNHTQMMTTVAYYSTPEPPSCTDVVVNCTLLKEYASYEAIKQTRAVLVVVANLTTLLPTSPGDYPSTAANFPFLNGTSTAAGKFNMTEWWTMMHDLIPRTDLAQIFSPNGTSAAAGSSSSADFSSESWSEYLEIENYTFWTNDSSIDPNDTLGLWVPENRTALVSALPIIIKLINAYLATLIPTLAKTTPFVDDFTSSSTGPGGVMNVTINPQGHSLPNGRFGGITLHPGEFTTFLENSTGRSTKKPRMGRKKARKKAQETTVSRSKRQFVPWDSRSRGSTNSRGKSITISNSGTSTTSLTTSLSSSSSTTTTDAPDDDYTQPDWSKYPVVSGEVEPVDPGHSGEGPFVMIEGGETTTEEEESDMNNAITPMVGPGGDLILGENGRRKYMINKQTTRGDIPSEWDEEKTTSTTTEMTSTSSTTMAPSTTLEPTPDSLERFLTNVMTMVTLRFSHNSTKTDENDLSRIRDISKWITTLESVIETKKVTQAYLNSTFGTTGKVNVDEKEVKTCYVTLCENGTTVPKDLMEFRNCSDILCTLESLLGPRLDNCWIPRSSMCISKSSISRYTSIKYEGIRLPQCHFNVLYLQQLRSLHQQWIPT